MTLQTAVQAVIAEWEEHGFATDGQMEYLRKALEAEQAQAVEATTTKTEQVAGAISKHISTPLIQREVIAAAQYIAHRYMRPATPPAIKDSLTVAELSAELDAGMAAQNYCRGLWGAARGHSDWRKVHDSFVAGYDQGRYDELQAQGPEKSVWDKYAPLQNEGEA